MSELSAFAIGLSRKARAIIRQNPWMSLAVIALLILATTTGIIGIGPAVFVHEGSTLVVVGTPFACCATTSREAHAATAADDLRVRECVGVARGQGGPR